MQLHCLSVATTTTPASAARGLGLGLSEPQLVQHERLVVALLADPAVAVTRAEVPGVEVELGDDGAAALRLQRAQLRRPLRRLPAQRIAPGRFSTTSRHIARAAERIVSI